MSKQTQSKKDNLFYYIEFFFSHVSSSYVNMKAQAVNIKACISSGSVFAKL